MMDTRLKIGLILLILVVIMTAGRFVLEKHFCNSCDRGELFCDENTKLFFLNDPKFDMVRNCYCCACIKYFKGTECFHCTWGDVVVCDKGEGFYILTEQ